MIRDTYILSRHEAKSVKHGTHSLWWLPGYPSCLEHGPAKSNNIMISINCSNDSRVFDRGNERILTLHFDDIEKDHDDLVLFTSLQASEIIEFVSKWKDSPDVYDLLIHCYAGICRSGAVGRAVTEWLGTNEEFEETNNWIQPNTHVLAMMRQCLNIFPYDMYTAD